MELTSSQSDGALTVLHIGVGAFHRAHQAAYFHRLRNTGASPWRLVGSNVRPDQEHVMAALARQGGAYVLETISPAGGHLYERLRIDQLIPYEPGHDALIAVGGDPSTRIISFTVTEAGYHLDSADDLDVGHPDIANDIAALAGDGRVSTLYGVLTLILRQRLARHAGAVTLLSCDNLIHNGRRSRSGLLQFAARLGDETLCQFIESSTTSPNAMVDRITPRPTAAVGNRVLKAVGSPAEAAVMAETFIQWVIEDDFIAGRPSWETVGAELVFDVAPYEAAKIRVLNGSHSAIAWAGTLAGYRLIDEGASAPRIRRIVHDYVTSAVIPCLVPSPVDLPRYRDAVLERFKNAALGDTNQRVLQHSFTKLGGFIAPTVSDLLDADRDLTAVAALPALYLAFLQAWRAGRVPFDYEEPEQDLAAVIAIVEAPDPVAAMCWNASIWGRHAGDDRLMAAVRRAAATLRELKESNQA